MPMEIKKDTFSFCELFTRSKCEQAVSLEINLPDYCSDIKKILKCTVKAGISNVSVSGENVNLSGTAVTRLIYVGENEKIDCLEHTDALSCSTRIKDMPENPLIKAVTRTDYINCRALSQRRISVSGNIGAAVYVYRENKKEFPCHIDSPDMECKKEKKTVSNLICQTEKTFDLSETVALDKDREDIGKILRSDCTVKLESKKAVADKLLIKGELCCEILYTDSEKNGIVKVTHSMPISQILGVGGITEKSDIQLSLAPSQFTVSAKNDSAGRCRLLELAARVSAVVRCREDKEIEIIKDCYSTRYEVTGDYKNAEFHTCAFNGEREIPFEETVYFSDGNIAEIKDMWCSGDECRMSGGEKAAEGECDFLLHGIYTDSDGSCRYAEKNLSAKVGVPLKAKGEKTDCDCDITVTSLSWSDAGGGKVKIKGTVLLNCYASVCSESRFLSDIRQSEKEKEQKYPALCICYARKGEKIWDIAKHYNTTESLIKNENGIKDEMTDKEMMLMIPCV